VTSGEVGAAIWIVKLKRITEQNIEKTNLHCALELLRAE